jgi:hypothetical protein
MFGGLSYRNNDDGFEDKNRDFLVTVKGIRVKEGLVGM